MPRKGFANLHTHLILKMSINRLALKEEMAAEIAPLPAVMVEPLLRHALLEDLGRAGDLTSDAIVPPQARARMQLAARQDGVLAGMQLAQMAFQLMDPAADFQALRGDGSRVRAGEVIGTVEGAARALLGAERCALNFLCQLSGVATATASIADAIRPYGARVSCTRKTAPGLRAVQKYAVRVGGGSNHRYGLDDAVLIKDNHIAIAGGVASAISRARAGVGHMVRIQLEVDTLAQLEAGLAQGVDAVLLDNMDLDALRAAVRLVDGRAVVEASGRITPETAAPIAQTGVDLMAVGWITHSAPVLDIGLDIRHV